MTSATIFFHNTQVHFDLWVCLFLHFKSLLPFHLGTLLLFLFPHSTLVRSVFFFFGSNRIEMHTMEQKWWLLFSTNWEKNNLQYCDSINIITTKTSYIVELMDLKNETQCHLFIFISHANLSSFPPCIDYSLFLSSLLFHFSYIIVLEIIFKHQDI